MKRLDDFGCINQQPLIGTNALIFVFWPRQSDGTCEANSYLTQVAIKANCLPAQPAHCSPSAWRVSDAACRAPGNAINPAFCCPPRFARPVSPRSLGVTCCQGNHLLPGRTKQVGDGNVLVFRNMQPLPCHGPIAGPSLHVRIRPTATRCRGLPEHHLGCCADEVLENPGAGADDVPSKLAVRCMLPCFGMVPF